MIQPLNLGIQKVNTPEMNPISCFPPPSTYHILSKYFTKQRQYTSIDLPSICLRAPLSYHLLCCLYPFIRKPLFYFHHSNLLNDWHDFEIEDAFDKRYWGKQRRFKNRRKVWQGDFA